ncbi:MAG: hypothetical protein AAF490_25595 [Chloroflexota bacterium]
MVTENFFQIHFKKISPVDLFADTLKTAVNYLPPFNNAFPYSLS